MKLISLMLCLATALGTGCSTRLIEVDSGSGSTTGKPFAMNFSMNILKPEKFVRYDDRSYVVKGIEVPVSGGGSPIKIGELEIRREVVRQASENLQLLDQLQHDTAVGISQMSRGAVRDQYIQRRMDQMHDLVFFAMALQGAATTSQYEGIVNDMSAKVQRWQEIVQ